VYIRVNGVLQTATSNGISVSTSKLSS
jgi:diketogulonate reductase-like aldo/keto reductase